MIKQKKISNVKLNYVLKEVVEIPSLLLSKIIEVVRVFGVMKKAVDYKGYMHYSISDDIYRQILKEGGEYYATKAKDY